MTGRVLSPHLAKMRFTGRQQAPGSSGERPFARVQSHGSTECPTPAPLDLRGSEAASLAAPRGGARCEEQALTGAHACHCPGQSLQAWPPASPLSPFPTCFRVWILSAAAALLGSSVAAPPVVPWVTAGTCSPRPGCGWPWGSGRGTGVDRG